jgi:hypothetical protein
MHLIDLKEEDKTSVSIVILGSNDRFVYGELKQGWARMFSGPDTPKVATKIEPEEHSQDKNT